MKYCWSWIWIKVLVLALIVFHSQNLRATSKHVHNFQLDEVVGSFLFQGGDGMEVNLLTVGYMASF